MYNALAAKAALPNQPVTKAAPTPQKATKPVAPSPGFNSKPDKDANAGQSPAMVGDRQKIARPPAPQIQATMPSRAPDQRSGMETSMGALADQLHPPKRR